MPPKGDPAPWVGPDPIVKEGESESAMDEFEEDTKDDFVEAYVAFSALCQASHVFKLAAPPPLSNLVAKSSTIHSTDFPVVYRPTQCVYSA